jgi:hypothetical protein
VLNRQRTGVADIKIHADRTIPPNAGRVKSDTPVTAFVACQRIIHEPGAGAERYLSRFIKVLAAGLKSFVQKRYGVRAVRDECK